MAIAASSVTPTNSLEDFRIEFNNLVSDVTGITATNVFTENIIFEGATADAYETTLAVTDPTADRTLTLPNVTGNVTVSGNPVSADGEALGSTSLEWSDLYLADGGVVYFGADQDVTLTHVADAGLLLNTSMYLTFRDAALKIHSSADGQLDIDADTEVEITATTVDLNGNLDVSGTYTGGGLMTTGGNIVIPNDGNIGSVGDTDAIAISSSGVVTFSQTPVFSGDSTFSDDISLSSDGAVINFGADSEVTLTHVHNMGLTLNSDNHLRFGDAGTYIHQSADGVLDLVSDNEVEINGTTIDINGAVEISGATTQTGVSTSAAKDVFNAGMSVKNGSTSAGFIEFFEDSDNGTNKVTLIGPSSTSDVTITLPSSSATLATSGDITALAIALG